MKIAAMGKGLTWFLLLAAAALAAAYYTLPVNRVNMRSRLVMLGDLNSDNMWDSRDGALLTAFAADPFGRPADAAYKTDVNHNGLLDAEDMAFLEALYAAGDPYKAKERAEAKGLPFPYPREFFRYVPETEYIQRPVITIEHKAEKDSPLPFLEQARLASAGGGGYRAALLHEIYSEGIRFSLAYARRAPGLAPKEKEYGDGKIRRCGALWAAGRHYELLLELMALTEDAETLTVKGQPAFVAQSLYLRDHLRALLESPLYKDYTAGKVPDEEVFKAIERCVLEDMKMKVDLQTLAPPRAPPESWRTRRWRTITCPWCCCSGKRWP